jgi:hypothetical protein
MIADPVKKRNHKKPSYANIPASSSGNFFLGGKTSKQFSWFFPSESHIHKK